MPLHVRHSVLQKSEDLLPFVNPVSLEGAVRGQDVPLITVKITTLSRTGETIIGISWNHILGMYAECKPKLPTSLMLTVETIR